MNRFKDLREGVVKSADKKPEVYVAPDGKKHVRMVPVNKQIIKTERKLTPGEKKKREEIAKAMERDNPGMDMKKKMAIATWQAKKVAEAKGPKIDPEKMAAHMARNVKPPKPKKMTSTQKSLASVREISKDKLGQYIKHATSDVSRRASNLSTDYSTKALNKLTKRQVGIHKAVDRLTKEAVDPSDTGGKEETDMAMGQLKFMQHAIEGIMARVQKDGDMEEWFQNKLTKAHEDLKSLYSYSKGEQE